MTYADRSMTRLKVIHILHKSRDFGFDFSAQLFTDACGPGVRMHVKVRVRGIVVPCLPASLGIRQDGVLHRRMQRIGIEAG